MSEEPLFHKALAKTPTERAAFLEYRESLAICQKLSDDNPAIAEFHSSLASTHHNLAWPDSRRRSAWATGMQTGIAPWTPSTRSAPTLIFRH